MITSNTFNFLKSLKDNNSKEWMKDHRHEYYTTKNNVEDFASNLIYEISKFDEMIASRPPHPTKCVTRLTRDMRFPTTKGPYKWDYYVVVGYQGIQGLAASYAVHIEPGNCFVGGGTPNPKGIDLLNYRQKVSDKFDAFKNIVENPTFIDLFPNGITSQLGIVKKRVPAAFQKNDPASEYLKKEGFITREKLEDEDLQTSEGFAKIIKLLKGSFPLVEFLNKP
jgi:uncharacterized protein (TIGR02453 family)